MTAILRYNNSVAYARNVLGWAAAYATGVVPVDLPPITGPIPPIGDMHLDNYQGLGPGLPMNVLGLPADDPLALMPLVDMGRTDVASQIPVYRPGRRPGRCRDPRRWRSAARCRSSLHRRRGCRRGCSRRRRRSRPPCAVFCITQRARRRRLLPARCRVRRRCLHAAGRRPCGSGPPNRACRHRRRPQQPTPPVLPPALGPSAGSGARTGWSRTSVESAETRLVGSAYTRR